MAFAHFTLATRDLSKSRDFYAEALGWQPIARPSNAPLPTTWLEIAPGQEVHLVQVDDFVVSAFEREYGRHIALAFPVTEFEQLKKRLVACGGELVTPDRPTPFERFFFKDPNGYVFEVVDADREPETARPGG